MAILRRTLAAAPAVMVVVSVMVVFAGVLGVTSVDEAAAQHAPGAPARTSARQQEAMSSLQLVDQDLWLVSRGTFRMRLAVVAPPTGGTLRVTQHLPTTDVAAVMSGVEPSTPPRRVVAREPVRDSATVELSLDVVPTNDGTPGDPLVLDNGVHPFYVELLDAEERPVDAVVTHIVQTSAGARSVPVALVVPFDRPPDRSEEGRARVDSVSVGQVTAPFSALSHFDGVPATVQVRPETVSALFETPTAEAEGALDALRTATAEPSAVLTGPFVALQASSWVEAGLAGMVGSQLDTGFTTLFSLGLTPRTATATLQERPSAEALDYLAARNIDRVVVPSGPGAGPLGRGALSVTGSPVAVVELADMPAATGDVAEQAYRLVAALALGAGAGPDRGGGMAFPGRAIRLEAATDPDRERLRIVLQALAVSGPLRPVTVDELATEAATAGSVTNVAQLRTEPVPPLPPALARIPATVNALRSLATVIDRPDVVADLGGSLLIAAGREVTTGARDALVGRVVRAIDEVVDAVVVPESDTIAVTAYDTNLPLLIRNDSEATLRISLRLSSTELEFTGANPLELMLPPGSTDVEVPIRARRSGELDLTVRLTSPDGEITLGETQWTVRSRAIPGGGLALTIGAVAFLLLWWLRNLRSSRGGRRDFALPSHPWGQHADLRIRGSASACRGGSVSGLPE